jgi:hypothetical protein
VPYRSPRPLPAGRARGLLVRTRYFPPWRHAAWLATWWPWVAIGSTLALIAVTGAVGPPTALVLFVVGWVAAMAVQLPVVRSRQARLQRIAALGERASALAAAGAIDDALAVLDRLADGTRTFPVQHGIAVMRRAALLTMRGELDEAEALLDMLDAAGTFAARRLVAERVELLRHVAMAAIVRGELERAAQALARARAALAPEQHPTLLALEALLSARCGRFAAASREVAEGWDAAESVCSPFEMGVLALVRAFTLEVAMPAARDRTGEIAELLERARAISPATYAGLADRWEEFGMFVDRHGLHRDVPREMRA